MLIFYHEHLFKNQLILVTQPKCAKNMPNMPNMPKCQIIFLDAKRFQNVPKFSNLASNMSTFATLRWPAPSQRLRRLASPVTGVRRLAYLMPNKRFLTYF